MNSDPFYTDIIDGLNERLDHELFELCAADLIRDDWPVVPVKGGSDAGMDGAVADGEGEAFPLVTTTSPQAMRNLTSNLKSYKEEGGRRRKAIFATSQELTPQRRRNLEDRAHELGFTLVQIYEQTAIANLLYRHPDWCKKLLDLSGDPAPLSIVPKTKRPLLDQTIVGREDELKWLSGTEGDRLLVGQPGSGKTFVLHHLALSGKGLFVATRDRSEIASGLRGQQPDLLIVDDAQGEEDLIADLRHLREETGATFSILASCWPGDKEDLKQCLGLPENQVLELPLLTRDEIVEVIRGAGLHGPRELLQHIVDQAEGRPGFAVTLTQMCLQGGAREVVYGDALSENIISTFRPVVGPEAKDILAVLSVGGEAGMSMEVAANVLDVKLVEVRRVLNELAAGGVIMEIRSPWGHRSESPSPAAWLQVRPAALRHVLIRDVFFGGATSLPIEKVLRHTPSLEHTALELIGAKARGADIDPGWLHNVIERVDSRKAWQMYASIGNEEAKWILQSHPDKTIIVARQALANAPELTIPRLLDEAIGDNRSLPSTPGHPIRIIKDWVLSGRPGTGSALARRRTLFDVACKWIEEGGDAETGVKAMQFALSLNFEARPLEPGSGYTISMLYGVLTDEEIRPLVSLWDEFWDFVDAQGVRHWQPILEVFHDWIHPGHKGGKASEEMKEVAHGCAEDQIKAALRHAEDRPGIRRRLAPMAHQFGLEVDFSGHDAFAILYPEEDLDNWKESSKRQKKAVVEVAGRWSERDPEEIAEKIQEIESEARQAELRYPRYTDLLCGELARRVDSPLTWTDVFVKCGFDSQFVAPFFHHMAEKSERGWRERARTLLDSPKYRLPPIQLALTRPELAGDLVEEALSHLDGYAHEVGTLCLRGDVPEDMVHRLLVHELADVRKESAEGEWRTDPEGQVRSGLSEAWRNVVVNDLSKSHILPQVFEVNPDLAFDWIQERLHEDNPYILLEVGDEKEVDAAVQALSQNRRRDLLNELRDTPHHLAWTRAIVGSEPEIYRALLSKKEIERLHLAPLIGHGDDEVWVEMMKCALDAGYDPQRVAETCNPRFTQWIVGNLSAKWFERASRFERLTSHEDEQIQKVGEIGRKIAQEKAKQAKEREHREAVYGMR